MNKDAIINRIAHTTGCSRKEVLDTLKKFGILPSGSTTQGTKKDDLHRRVLHT